MTISDKFKLRFPKLADDENKDHVCDMVQFMEYVTQRVRQELNLPPKQSRHEKIEQMAWDMYCRSGHYYSIEAAWDNAEEFYNYAKAKEDAL